MLVTVRCGPVAADVKREEGEVPRMNGFNPGNAGIPACGCCGGIYGTCLLRHCLPRGTSFESGKPANCIKIAEKLNSRPIDGSAIKMPNEVYYKRPDLDRRWAAACGRLFAPVLGSGPLATPPANTIGVALLI